jgi:hypothetical protein
MGERGAVGEDEAEVDSRSNSMKTKLEPTFRGARVVNHLEVNLANANIGLWLARAKPFFHSPRRQNM